jgi:signal transduction histidine kinase
VGAQAWVAGGLEVPGLFLLPALLMLSAGLLGQGPTLALLGAMLALVLALGLPWVGAMPGGLQPLGPMPAGYRAVVMAFLLVLTYIGLQVFVRAHRRDVRAIKALNDKLSNAFDELKLRQEALLAAQHEVEAFNQVLERRVQARTAELSSSLEQLQETQRELVQAEKMAALGSLVAGVAHELHTPLQQALSGANTARSTTASVQARLRSGQAFRKSELEQWLQQCHDNADQAQTALHRCLNLVENFKTVAADQRTLTRRTFELAPMLERLAEALRPTLGEGVILDLDVEPGLRMDSYPGALDQIVIELVRNAAAHGFRDGRTGCIRLTVNTLGTDVVDLRCIDDGEGLTPTMQHRVFEPFFSTRLGQGGAGLGLAVAYGLAVHVLQGSLNVTCSPTEGTCFRLLVPRVVVGGQVECLQAAA